MKKLLYYTFLLFILWVNFCISVVADQSKKPSSFFAQGRIGVGIAAEYNNVDVRLKIQPSADLSDITSEQSQTGKHFQVAPYIEIGGTLVNDYYLGLLLSWRYSGLRNKATVPLKNALYFQHEFKLNNYADILLKTGYKINPCTMVYGVIGPSIANWTHTSNQILLGQTGADKYQINKTSPGLGIGIGFEYFIKKNYAISIDYTQHFYRSTSKHQIMTIETPVINGPNIVDSGDVNKKIDLSYATIAVRFTMFFQL